VKLNERLLRFITPQVLHERINHGASRRDVLIDHNRRMLAEDRRLRHDNFDRELRFFINNASSS
jgi:hypothetical protein